MPSSSSSSFYTNTTIMIIVIIVIVIFLNEIIDVSIIADVTVYLGKKQNKTKANKNKTGKKAHTHVFIPTSSFRRAVLPYIFGLEVKFVN